MKILDHDHLDSLVSALRRQGFRTAGPRLRGAAVGYDWIDSAADLPLGVKDEHAPGRYRLSRANAGRVFGCTVPTPSARRLFLPPRETLFRTRRTPDGIAFEAAGAAEAPVAIVGLRPCDLAALHVLDRVMGCWGSGNGSAESRWLQRRRRTFVVVAQCTRPLATCFCADMGTGPFAAAGFDLALVELADGFAVSAGSAAGEAVLGELDTRQPGAGQLEAVSALRRAADNAARAPRVASARELLAERLEHPAWAAVARRCLACGNCTSVCPTCFCTSLEEAPGPGAGEAVRTRRWASCFETGFSYQVGGSVRRSVEARYRHWLRHKLCTWREQFDTTGCVGCGRCIAWCPVGIDLRAQLAALARPAREEATDDG